jgi:AcrR family transcriptional regulator
MARKKDPELEAARRAQVLAAATELLVKESWQTVTLDRVAERARVSKGVVTYWFTNKDALLLAAIERFHAGYAERLLSAAQGGSARARLRRLVRVAFPDRETVERELRFQVEVWSYSKERPEVRAAVSAAYRAFAQFLQALVESGAAERGARPPRDLHLLVHAMVDGLSVRTAFDEEVDVPRLRRTLVAWLEGVFGLGRPDEGASTRRSRPTAASRPGA